MLFDRLSGQTHLLTEQLSAIWSVVPDQPSSLADIVTRLQAEFDIESDGDLAEVVAARLEKLAQLGLLQRVSADQPGR